MTIDVLLFASAQDAAGTRQVSLDLPEGAKAEELMEELTRRFPRLDAMRPYLRIAVNHTYADLTAVLHQGDEVAILPPVSGG